jgi:hypothetical protein
MDRITQAVMIGSPLESLNKKFISLEELLRWLLTAPLSDRSLVAYRAACQVKPPNDHYFSAETPTSTTDVFGRHFISCTHAPEYGAIFVLSGGDVNTPAFRDRNETLAPYLAATVAKLLNDTTFERKMKLICDKSGIPGRFIMDNRPLLFSCHSNSLIQEYLNRSNQSIESQSSFAIESDYFEALRVTDNLTDHLMARCRTLMTTAPLYWEGVAKSRYQEFFSKLIADKKLSRSNKAQAFEINTMFPGIFGISLERLSDLAYKIMCLEFPVQAYVLGFPIHHGLPSPAMVEELLYYLSSVGKDRYSEGFKTHTEKMTNAYLNPELTSWHRTEWKVRNSRDVLENNISEYNEFDQLLLINGVNVYFFVRPEFNNLLKSHKNHWTNEDLPRHLEVDIQARVLIAEDLKLPPAGTILELLTRTEDGTLYPAPAPPSASSNAGPTMESFLQLLLGSGGSGGTSATATIMPGVTVTASEVNSNAMNQLLNMIFGRPS